MSKIKFQRELDFGHGMQDVTGKPCFRGVTHSAADVDPANGATEQMSQIDSNIGRAHFNGGSQLTFQSASQQMLQEQQSTHVGQPTISKRLKHDIQNLPNNYQELVDSDKAGQQQPGQQQQRFQFSFGQARNNSQTVKLQSSALSKEKTYDYVRKNFPNLEDSDIQKLISEMKEVDNGEEKISEESTQSVGQINRQDANKLAQRQMQSMHQKGQILNRFQSEQMKCLYSAQNSQLLQRFKLPPKLAAASGGPDQTQNIQPTTKQQPRVSKKRGYNRGFNDFQQKENDSQNAAINQQMTNRESPRLQSDADTKRATSSHQDFQQSTQIHNESSLPMSSQSDSQNMDSPKSDKLINQQQIQQLKRELQFSKDRFFSSLENNLEQYVNDRSAAYNFINNELNIYDDATLVYMNQLLQKSGREGSYSEAINRENNILKRGIRIFNQKYDKLKAFSDSMKQQVNQSQYRVQEKEEDLAKCRQLMRENESKVRNFDQLLAAYQKQSHEMDNQRKQIEMLKVQNQFLLRSSITEPHLNNHNFGGANGSNFDGGVC